MKYGKQNNIRYRTIQSNIAIFMAFTTCGKATRIVEYRDLSKMMIMSKISEMLIGRMGLNDVIDDGRSAPEHRRVHSTFFLCILPFSCASYPFYTFLDNSLFLRIDVRYSLCSDVGEYYLGDHNN